MIVRSTSLVLPLSDEEKEFLLSAAEKTHLSISDFVLLSALSLNLPTKEIYYKKPFLKTGDIEEL